ncbi:MAG: hypothetical protein PHU61_01875 [Candidatus Absconditabacteria bacterium]|nr:hypothetical protein [Candidatus Absconditabacteria bacterium]MDD3868458.1 hypothetical protein [Candidatus Absconditabacteria bacterium]MDD4713968.1 hypothetical protein [Candidatus Absconditabacteria bacterium]
MKRKLPAFLLICSVISLGYIGTQVQASYTPTESDNTKLAQLKNILISSDNKDLRNYYDQFKQLSKITIGEERVQYLLEHLRDFSYTQFSSRKNLAKQQSITYKNDFGDEYKEDITLEQDVYENCLGRYNSLDNISFANNFPTALTIAVRYRESTCGYALPRNGDGPFQIVSKDYGTGTITEELFFQTVQDFMDFSRNKINRYNERNKADGLSIDLSYTGASYTDLWRFAALYNGLSGATVYGEISPAAPKYFFEGYENEVRSGSSTRYGLFPKYLKILERELTQ